MRHVRLDSSDRIKLVVAVVHGRDADAVLRGLASRGYGATTIDSSGGLLRQGNVTLLVGVQETLVSEAVALIKRFGQVRSQYVNPLLPVAEPAEVFIPSPVEVQVGGATVFVVGVDRYERIA